MFIDTKSRKREREEAIEKNLKINQKNEEQLDNIKKKKKIELRQ